MPREELLTLVGKVQSGAFGLNLQQLAAARARNQSVGTLSDEDLRSWLQDIARLE